MALRLAFRRRNTPPVCSPFRTPSPTPEPTPEPPIAAFSGLPLAGVAPLEVTFTDESLNGPTSWAWDFENTGSTDSIEQNPTHTYAAAGTYSVKLTVTNSAGSDSLVKSNYVGANAQVVAIASTASPRVLVYPWSDTTGFGTKFANPATLPTGNGASVAFSPSDATLAVGLGSPRDLNCYAWSNTTGFGTKFADPPGKPGSIGSSLAFSPSGTSLVLGSATGTESIAAWVWDDTTGFGTKFADPSPLVGARGLAFNKNGTVLVASHNGTPGTTAYSWSDVTGFGTKFADPSVAINNNSRAVAFSKSQKTIGFAHSNTPYVAAYSWSDTTGFGTKFANPSVLATDAGYSIAFQ